MATLLNTKIKSVSISDGISKRTNTSYSQICVLFKDGYELKKFLTNEEKYILNNLLCSNSVPNNSNELADLDLGDFAV